MKKLSHEALKPLTPWMQSYVDAGKLAGASVLVAQDGKVVFTNGVGKRGSDRQDAFDRSTISRIYSMTKPVTAVALMQLLEQGKLALHQPVSDILPEFNNCTALVTDALDITQTETCKPPTLFQLLTHTSGLTYAFNSGVLPEHYAAQGVNFDPAAGALRAATQRLAKQPLAFQPGAKWEYSVGLDVIGAVIEQVSGIPLDVYFQKKIFAPLGMTETSFTIADTHLPRFANCYAVTSDDTLAMFDDNIQTPFHKDAKPTFSGGGGLVSTLDDYLKFAEFLRTKGVETSVPILGSASIDLLCHNQLESDIAAMGPSSFAEMPMTGVGFGLGGAVILDPAKSGMAGSCGDFSWGGMASTYFWIDRKNALSGIFFTQLIPSSTYPLRNELKRLVHKAFD